MAQDPYRPPMSLRESEELLNRSGDWEATKAGWAGMFGELQLLVVVVGVIGAAALALWAGSSLFGATAAGVAGLVFALVWLNRRP